MEPIGVIIYRKFVAEWHPCSSPFRVRWTHCQDEASWQRLLSSAPTRKLLRFQVSLCGQLGAETCDCARFSSPLSVPSLSFLAPYPSLPPLFPPLSPPDPIPVLKQGVMHHQKLMQAQDFEIENKQLRETLQEYNSEFAQVESTITTVYSSSLRFSFLFISCTDAQLYTLFMLIRFPGLVFILRVYQLLIL